MELSKKGIILIVLIFFAVIFSIAKIIFSDEKPKQGPIEKFTQEEIQKAETFITALEATGLIKEIKNQCADNSQGCYYFIIDENLWNNTVNYQTKEQLVTASEIYASNKEPFKFVEGKGYNSGKKLFDIFGVKN